MNCPPCTNNCNQGKACPAFHPHRLNTSDFDTLEKRMQEPTQGYSVWVAIAAFVFLVIGIGVWWAQKKGWL